MLFTMEHEAKSGCYMFPNPERIDKVYKCNESYFHGMDSKFVLGVFGFKVEDSMKSIETVVRERNRAYFLLETGSTGERPGEEVENFLGLQEYVQHKEYPIPKEENKEYLKEKEAEPKASDEEKGGFLYAGEIRRRNLSGRSYGEFMKLK